MYWESFERNVKIAKRKKEETLKKKFEATVEEGGRKPRRKSLKFALLCYRREKQGGFTPGDQKTSVKLGLV